MRGLRVGLVAAVVSGCFLTGPERPSCNVDPRYADDRVGSAGCMVAVDDQLLVVRTADNGKLGFPAGYAEQGERAQCTAHRETWEEAGLPVQVTRLLRTFPNGFHLYACELVDTERATGESFPVPRQARNEITEVALRHPADLSRTDWRFPEQLPTVVKLFQSLAPVRSSPRSSPRETGHPWQKVGTPS